MPRAVVYGASLGIFVGATALTLSAILIPRWISYEERASTGIISTQLGLYSRCFSLPRSPQNCTPFPTDSDDRYFSSMWRSTSFLMNFAIMLEAIGMVGFIAILAEGRAKRVYGWKTLVVLLGAIAIVQCTATSLVDYLYDYDAQFFMGWRLDLSWMLATVSWSIMALLAVFVAMAGWLLPPDEGYVLLK